MTVEKNGQLAWTFEELDFEGAHLELRELLDKNSVRMNVLSDLLGENSDDDSIRVFLKVEIEKCFEISEKYWPICQYLLNLKYNRPFNFVRRSKK